MLDIIFMFLLSFHHLTSAQEENEAALEMGRKKDSIMLFETMEICHERAANEGNGERLRASWERELFSL